MTPAEFAAYIGAASWLPQIVKWIYSSRSTPQLRLSSAPQVEIGYTPSGPIVNITAALSVERRDALVERISLTSKHEKGEARAFQWVLLNEPGIRQIQLPTVGPMDVLSNQPAVAMKVSTLGLVEKKVCFQDQDFQRAYRKLEMTVNDQFMSHRGQEEPEATTFATRQFTELRRFFDDNFYWKEGDYRFDVALHEARLRTPHVESFRVTFARNHIDDLRKNLTRLQEYYTQQWAGLQGRQPAPVYFNWVYPDIAKLQT